MWTSALETAHFKDKIEFVVYRDNDDTSEYEYPRNKTIWEGERIVLSEMWNECAKKATGDILMHAGDDIVFKTQGWDTQVIEAFEQFPDKIAFVHGDDGFHGAAFGTHGFIHRNWMEAVGYFVPPYFSSDYNDTWLNDVANMIGRRVYIPIVTEHMHWTFNKGPKDQTHLDRLERHQKDNVAQIYQDTLGKRMNDAEKLKCVMNK